MLYGTHYSARRQSEALVSSLPSYTQAMRRLLWRGGSDTFIRGPASDREGGGSKTYVSGTRRDSSLRVILLL